MLKRWAIVGVSLRDQGWPERRGPLARRRVCSDKIFKDAFSSSCSSFPFVQVRACPDYPCPSVVKNILT